ncbi:MAG: FkbM family methyltransferase [Pseudomonadota bacterium]
MILRYLRRLIPQYVRTRTKKVFGMATTRLHPDWDILRLIGPLERPHVVLDVGAHHGWFLHSWQEWCPKAEVHAFEPTAESYAKMNDLYGKNPRVHLVRAGVGAQAGELTLKILKESQVSNSFLTPDATIWGGIEYRTGDIEQRLVSVITLDDYCARAGIQSVFMIKIDVQGFEKEVLKGAGRTLEITDYVFVESGIRRLYEGAPSFAEVHLEMEKRGFHLMTMRAWHRGNNSLVETDMLFRRNELTPDIDRQQDRYYVELR